MRVDGAIRILLDEITHQAAQRVAELRIIGRKYPLHSRERDTSGLTCTACCTTSVISPLPGPRSARISPRHSITDLDQAPRRCSGNQAVGSSATVCNGFSNIALEGHISCRHTQTDTKRRAEQKTRRLRPREPRRRHQQLRGPVSPNKVEATRAASPALRARAVARVRSPCGVWPACAHAGVVLGRALSPNPWPQVRPTNHDEGCCRHRWRAWNWPGLRLCARTIRLRHCDCRLADPEMERTRARQEIGRRSEIYDADVASLRAPRGHRDVRPQIRADRLSAEQCREGQSSQHPRYHRG